MDRRREKALADFQPTVEALGMTPVPGQLPDRRISWILSACSSALIGLSLTSAMSWWGA